MVLVDGFDTENVWNYRHDRAAGGTAQIVDEGRTGKGLKVTSTSTQATATRSAGGVLRAEDDQNKAAARVGVGQGRHATPVVTISYN